MSEIFGKITSLRVKGGFLLDDRSIIQLYWERDEAAICATEEKYGNYCGSIARNILDDAQEAEECVNDTYLHAWNSMPPHRPLILSAFLGRITRNLSFDRLRYSNAIKRGGGKACAVLDELGDCVSGVDWVERELERRELVRVINLFLASLTPKKRQMFVCRYWYCDSVTDIAEKFNIKPGTVSTELRRIRVHMVEYLAERGFEL